MKYAAFLRAINVSGSNPIKMTLLQDLFTSSGFSDVRTYLQSGNVVFSARSASKNKIEEIIESALLATLGLHVTVIIRTKRELETLLLKNPFLAKGYRSDFLFVTLLKSTVAVRSIDPSTVRKERAEEFRLEGDRVYLYCPNGYGRTRLNNALWEKLTGSAATTRNWKTLTAVHELVK